MQATRLSWPAWTGVAALLLLHVALALGAAAGKSVTVDEIFHLTGGYLFDRYGDYRIHAENGVLPQRWHALPAVLAGAQPPSFTDEAWRTGHVYSVSHQFFYENNDHGAMLRRARMANLAWSLGAGLLVFFWARRMAGDLAGFTALGLLALSPTFLAHGPLATSDLSAAFLLPCSAGAFWWQLQMRRPGPTLASGVVFGLACVAKYSAVLLLPVFILLAAIHLLATPAAERRAGRVVASLLVHGVMAVAIIWTVFGFRYGMFAPDLPSGTNYFVQYWQMILGHLDWEADVINFCRQWRLLPEGFLLGFSNTYAGAQARGAFLAGEYSTTGWLRFFPLAFLWKSTGAELTGLALAAVAAGLHVRKLRAWLYPLAPLLVWSAIYGLAAVTSHLNIGHRHLLPLYPGLFIIAGIAVARLLPSARWRYGLAAGVAGLQVVAAAGIHPHHLAYFNALAGGPANGHRLLVDSSLDWGQDLPALHDWLAANNPPGPAQTRVYLSYFGSGKPEYHQLAVTQLPFVNGFNFVHPYYQMTGGIYCVSATMLQEVYGLRGDFTAESERQYQSLIPYTDAFRAYWQGPEGRTHVLGSLLTEEALLRAWVSFDQLRFSRLCQYLRARGPDATAGYSILIYRLTDAEIKRVLHGTYSEWAAAVEEAGRNRR